MLVWLDWVPNHTATNASWVSQHPDYYTWSNGQMVHPNGYGDVYELNYGNQSLQNAMTDCLKFWVDQANVDGYRCDYVASPTIPNTYWQNAIGQLSNYRNKKIEFLAESNLTWDHYLDNVNVGFSYDYAWSFQTDLVNIGNGTSASALQNAANTLINVLVAANPLHVCSTSPTTIRTITRTTRRSRQNMATTNICLPCSTTRSMVCRSSTTGRK